ncbi:MAG: winged helix-turn-helix domain-containing protein [Anaerolineales bacterium]|nr:winged helix-turn-helix domain-containing protein [Anaerolineales bacterium]
MTFDFENCPFSPPQTWIPDEEERWWANCYLPHLSESALHDSPQWLILRGGYQSGKTTALSALRRARSQNALVLIKDFAIEVLTSEPPTNILLWIMRTASWDLREYLSRRPELIHTLSQTQREFLRWAIEKFHKTRAFARWLDGLPSAAAQELQEIPFIDLYPTQTTTYDVQGQIEELVNLCTRLGFQQVLVTVDVPPFPELQIVKEIDSFLGWLEPMQHPQLQLVLALPPDFCNPERLKLTRGRVKIIDISPSNRHTQTTIHRYLTTATNGNIQQIEQLCTKALFEQLNSFILQEFDSPVVGAWVKFLQIILERAKHWVEGGKTLPLEGACFNGMVREYCRHYLPLKKAADDNHLGVWRGHRWIRLDRSSYDFLMLLFRSRGHPIDHIHTQTKKSNLHTLARRLRVAIEPIPSDPVYVQNIRGEGYWLEYFKSDQSYQED